MAPSLNAEYSKKLLRIAFCALSCGLIVLQKKFLKIEGRKTVACTLLYGGLIRLK